MIPELLLEAAAQWEGCMLGYTDCLVSLGQVREAQGWAEHRRECGPYSLYFSRSTCAHLQLTFPGEAPGCGEKLSDSRCLPSQSRQWAPCRSTV